MKTLVLLLIPLALFGCDDGKETTKRTDIGWGMEVRTIKHDGHLWVTANTGNTSGGLSIIHHPDCTCIPRR